MVSLYHLHDQKQNHYLKLSVVLQQNLFILFCKYRYSFIESIYFILAFFICIRIFIIFINLSMFPNDDICNIKAAKDAAKRLFDKYRAPLQPQTSSKSGLGQNEVSSLIKNAYDTINMPYDPNQQDVFSFMSVFNSENNGKIQLKDLQQMAIRYLCGQDALKQLQEKTKAIQITQLQSNKQSNQVSKQINKQTNENQYQQKTAKQDKKNQYTKVLSPGFLSPKAQINRNYFKSNSNFEIQNNQKNKEIKIREKQENYSKLEQSQIQKRSNKMHLSYKDILNKANRVFNQNLNENDELTQKEVPRLLTQTYELIGRKNYHPSKEDVIIWMKLCDSKRCGHVDWFQYQNYVKKMIERQGISQKNY